MFYGRKKELEILDSALKKKGASIMIYGKRKIGKTTLIKEALLQQNIPFIYYECIKSTMQDNLVLFAKELERNKLLPAPLQFANFIDAFNYLDSLNREMVIVIDEYPYLKTNEDSSYVDSVFQKIL